jgi:hypothetical protein
MPSASLQHDPEAQVWAARIESTRDAQEAWSAFMSYHEQGHQPTLQMYFAMIAKIQFEGARSGRKLQKDPSPGDGKEVFPPSNDNFSSFYQSHLQPPTSDELYQQMRHAGIRPTGRFLDFLIQKARTPDEGIMFLHDGRINRRAVAFLKGFKTINPVVLKQVPESTFAAFITLLCRFIPRIIPSTSSSNHTDTDHEPDVTHSQDRVSEMGGWEILETKRGFLSRRHLNPLLHCAFLLKTSQTRFRPAWYALFRGLARRGVIVDRSLVGDPRNDILAWKILAAALGDFHKCGLELDPQGFLILCIGFEKALMASFKFPEEQREDVLGKSQARIVMDEFMKLSAVEVNTTSHPTIPKLLHSIEGVHLHAYVRVLGLNEDYEGLKYVLQWMVENHAELDEIATQSANGSKLIRRTIIAMKVFFDRPGHEIKAEELVNSVDSWGGWPADEDSRDYLERWSGWIDSRDVEPPTELSEE